MFQFFRTRVSLSTAAMAASPAKATAVHRAITTAIAALLLGGCASLQNSPQPQPTAASRAEQVGHLFEVLDVNNDGRLSREEAQSGFRYLIASYDRGGKTEILAAKPGGQQSVSSKAKSKRRPTSQDANRAFEALFVNGGSGAVETLSRDEFKKLVVKASDNPETDPFASFYE